MFCFLLLSFQSFAQSEKYDKTSSIKTEAAGYIDPDMYFVGPGDSLLVLIKGLDEIAWKVRVSHEGTIYIPKVGELNIKSNSLTEAKKKIETSIKYFYKNVEIFVSLIEIRKIKVGLYGDVKKSTILTLPANACLSDVLLNSELINPSADLRNVKIVNDNDHSSFYDFISFIRTNDKIQNAQLKEGDFIYLDKSDRTFSIWGSVKFSASYNFKQSETVFDAINLAGGLLTNAKKDTIEIIRFADDFKTQNSFFVTLEDSKKFQLQNKDKVIIRSIPEYLLDEVVTVEGFVKYPGVYKIKDGETKLSEIINLAGGFLPKASLSDAALFRRTLADTTDVEFERLKNLLRKDMTDDEYDYLKAKARQPKGKVVINFQDIFENKITREDVILRKNDVIIVPEKKDYINLIGQVVQPGKIPFNVHLKVKDYIALAGGFGWRAIESDVRVVRASTGEWIDQDDAKILYPGDIIWIPEDPPPPKFWDFTKDALFIIGQVATVVTAAVAIIASRR
ncbi:MAG: SLBB domain-containing protein [Ignavibacteriaceae bacterium]|jgi:protein involved in polysaccharide export with SLBB domain